MLLHRLHGGGFMFATVGSSILFGCFLVVVVGVKVLGRYLFEDPCEGDGNFGPPMDYYTRVEEEPEKSKDKEDVNEKKKHSD
jgi:hypothetical protein